MQVDPAMDDDIGRYNLAQAQPWRAICDRLRNTIDRALVEATSKCWHGGPVWFLSGNPIVGYWVRKQRVQLLFWSGQSFARPGLIPEGKFKAAEISFGEADAIDEAALAAWLGEARAIQWDYKNLVKRKGELQRLTPAD
jgi:hypothetical protein